MGGVAGGSDLMAVVSLVLPSPVCRWCDRPISLDIVRGVLVWRHATDGGPATCARSREGGPPWTVEIVEVEPKKLSMSWRVS